MGQKTKERKNRESVGEIYRVKTDSEWVQSVKIF